MIDYVDLKEGSAFFPKFDVETQKHIGTPLIVSRKPIITTSNFNYSNIKKGYNFYFEVATTSTTTIYSTIVSKVFSHNVTVDGIETSPYGKQATVLTYGSQQNSGTLFFDLSVIETYNITSPFVAVAFARSDKGLESDLIISQELSI